MANTPAVAFMKDERGRYVYVNELFGKLFRPLDQLRGKTDFEIFPAEIAQQLTKNDQAVLVADTPLQIEESVPISRDSMHHWIVIKFPFRDRAGSRYVGGVAIDVTDRKQAEEQLVQAQRLAAIGEAMAGLAHESRNALQRSQAALELLVLRIQDRPEALELVAELESAQQYLHNLYEEVQGYAAPLTLKCARAHLGEILERAWRSLELVQKDRVLHLNQTGRHLDLHCEVDACAIEQVFRNLLENSLAACRGPVEITVGWSEGRLPKGPALRIAIRDSGPGFPPESHDKVFQPFYTTKTKGTGLGMPIARRIVERHSGKIFVTKDSQPGAEVVVTLPRELP